MFSNAAIVPKIALHDHLDGGVRPATLLELAAATGAPLPFKTIEELKIQIESGIASRSLESYLRIFGWTVPVMQDATALRRIAKEALEDLASDGVILAELRFAPLLHTAQGMTAQEVIDAVTAGLNDAIASTGVPAGLILCGIRSKDEFASIGELFFRNYRSPGSLIVGVDLAGQESGHPVKNHPAIQHLSHTIANAPITIHAGEADGISSIWQAVESGARRIGHGTRLIDDISADKSLMREIIDRDILLEVCLSSNVQTGAIAFISEHPLRRFLDQGVKVNIDVDNRLVSSTSYSNELAVARSIFGLTVAEHRKILIDALAASFLDDDTKALVRARHSDWLKRA